MGIFYRTIRMVDNGIKPVYVFDGKPPDMKSGEVSQGQSVCQTCWPLGPGWCGSYLRIMIFIKTSLTYYRR